MKRFKIVSVTLLMILFALTPVYADNSNRYGIEIDGSFDDWKAIKKFVLGYSPEGTYNGGNNHDISLLRDKDMLYIYIDMFSEYAPGYNHNDRKMQYYNHTLILDNQINFKFQLDLQDIKTLKNGETEVLYPLETAYKAPTYRPEKIVGAKAVRKSVFSQGLKGQLPNGQYVNQNDAYRDIIEISIPLSSIVSNPNQIKSIQYQNSNLGPQTYTFTGTPTGSTLIVISGFVLAIAGGFFFYRKRVH